MATHSYDPTKANVSDVYGATSSIPHEQEAPLNHGSRPPAGWDYVLVFRAPSSISQPISADQRRVDAARIAILLDLRQASFHYSQLWVPSSGIILVRLALPESSMMEKAEFSGLRYRTRPEYSGAFVPFSRSRAYIFENHNRRLNHLPFFTPAERLMLTQLTLTSNEQWGADIEVTTLSRDGLLKDAFGLHSRQERNLLIRACVSGSWWNPFRPPPLYALQEYLGTRVTMYLAWLVFFTRMQSGFAVFSLFIYAIVVWGYNASMVAWARFAYGIALAFWSSYWIRHWQRRTAILNVRWGLSEVQEDRENMIDQRFRGVDTPGFYCLGGFVHLDDLLESTGPATANSSSVSASAARAEEQSLDDHLIGVPQTEHDRQWTQSLRESDRTTLASLASHRVPDQELIRIGSVGDRDFSVEAPVIGRTFADLPTHPYFSSRDRHFRMRLSAMITIVFACLVGLASFSILFFRKKINTFVNVESGSAVITGVMTACLIIISDGLWQSFSVDLTRWENHHTTQSYEDSLIYKRFAFQFVSNYLTLFYIAFVKPFTANDPCTLNASGVPDCMLELQTQLTSVVITKATVEQVLELVVPNLLSFVLKIMGKVGENRLERLRTANDEELERLKESGAVIDDSILTHNSSQHEIGTSYLSRTYAEEDEKEENDIRAAIDECRRVPYSGTMVDYGEIIIQYGFVMLFGVAFPLAAVITLVNNLIEFRTDTYKILAFHRRAPIDIATGIGRWLDVIRFLSNLSVVTIVAILTITTSQLHYVLDDILPAAVFRQVFNSPLVSFVITEHLLFLIRWAVTSLIVEVPGSTYRLRARRSFLLSKCLDIGPWKPYYRGHRVNQAWRRAEV